MVGLGGKGALRFAADTAGVKELRPLYRENVGSFQEERALFRKEGFKGSEINLGGASTCPKSGFTVARKERLGVMP